MGTERSGPHGALRVASRVGGDPEIATVGDWSVGRCMGWETPGAGLESQIFQSCENLGVSSSQL